MKKFQILGASLAATLALAGCGGGGGGGDGGAATAVDATPASGASAVQGLWIGNTTTNRTITGLVFSDGTYYVFYSPVGNATAIAGVVQGSGTVAASAFSSSNGRDFNLEGLGVSSATVTANYASKQSFSGMIAYPAGTITTFTTACNATYEAAPSLASVAGTFTGRVSLSAGAQAATITVSSAGAISGNSNGCSLTGAATPRSDGNAYNLSVTFGAAPCFLANQTLTGVAYYDSVTKRLYAVAPNAARSDGVLFVGAKP